MAASDKVADLTVERVVPGGDGLARLDGVVVLVAGALPGDRLRARVERGRRGVLRARVVSVLEPGEARREPAEVCPRALDETCGGCDWPAVKLSSHEELKKAIVVDALRRISKIGEGDLPRPGWISSPRNYRLRNRLHVDSLGRIGFFGPRSNDVSRLETCEIVSRALLERLPAMREPFAEAGRAGELTTLEGLDGRTLIGRFRPALPLADPERLVKALQTAFDGLEVTWPDGAIAASAGPSSLTLEAGGAAFRVSVGSFFQGNRFLLARFLEEARRLLASCGDAGGKAVDLYAGGGFLTRPLLERGFRTTSVEVEGSSSLDLEANLSAWADAGLPRGTAVQSTAEAFLRGERGPATVVVADPPRAGLSPEVRRALLRLQPRSLLLVSCDPPTMARDLADLRRAYRVAELTLIDLFPGTHHVETMALLRKE